MDTIGLGNLDYLDIAVIPRDKIKYIGQLSNILKESDLNFVFSKLTIQDSSSNRLPK